VKGFNLFLQFLLPPLLAPFETIVHLCSEHGKQVDNDIKGNYPASYPPDVVLGLPIILPLREAQEGVPADEHAEFVEELGASKEAPLERFLVEDV